jgi:hypothetical protein
MTQPLNLFQKPKKLEPTEHSSFVGVSLFLPFPNECTIKSNHPIQAIWKTTKSK